MSGSFRGMAHRIAPLLTELLREMPAEFSMAELMQAAGIRNWSVTRATMVLALEVIGCAKKRSSQPAAWINALSPDKKRDDTYASYIFNEKPKPVAASARAVGGRKYDHRQMIEDRKSGMSWAAIGEKHDIPTLGSKSSGTRARAVVSDCPLVQRMTPDEIGQISFAPDPKPQEVDA